MRFTVVFILLVASIFAAAFHSGNDLQPIEQAQTAVAQSQAALQATPDAQVLATQTREVNPNPVITSNADWTPIEREFDGVTMVLVPAGCFDMGSTQYNNEQPVHEQCFDQPFWIDKYEVAQAQFRRLGGIQANPSGFSGDELPVERITWFEARDFCELRDSRLPTEAEWEYAARGPDNLVYPWGNEWDGTLANHCDMECAVENLGYMGTNDTDGYGFTAPVGSYPAGVSWVGALDMSGNVWEWTSSLYEAYPYDAEDGREADTGSRTNIRRVLRSGAWGNYDTGLLRAPFRSWYGPGYWGFEYGFRCARSYGGELGTAVMFESTDEISSMVPDEITPVTHNADWTPVERDFDGVIMVLVPAGCFNMGLDGSGGRQCFDEPFWIGKYEVTNAEYARFVEVGGYDNSEFWTEAGWAWRQANRFSGPRDFGENFNGPQQPRVGVSWYEAIAYANWRGLRLPTEAEWEYAACGLDALAYPWGDTFIEDNVVYPGTANERTADVGSRPGGISWVGALDMSGNVWEWTSSLNYAYPYDAADGREDMGILVNRVLHGGSWAGYGTGTFRCDYRFGYNPRYRYHHFGFRVSRAYD